MLEDKKPEIKPIKEEKKIGLNDILVTIHQKECL